jgi:hypothetical protein
MAGNKGTYGGWEKNARKRREWVYHALPDKMAGNRGGSLNIIGNWTELNASVYTGTRAVGLTGPLRELIGTNSGNTHTIPGLRALNILIIARINAAADSYMYLAHYRHGDPHVPGPVASELHYGKVSGHYDTTTAMVECDPDGRIWFAIPQGVTDSTLYARVMGYWVEPDR